MKIESPSFFGWKSETLSLSGDDYCKRDTVVNGIERIGYKHVDFFQVPIEKESEGEEGSCCPHPVEKWVNVTRRWPI